MQNIVPIQEDCIADTALVEHAAREREGEAPSATAVAGRETVHSSVVTAAIGAGPTDGQGVDDPAAPPAAIVRIAADNIETRPGRMRDLNHERVVAIAESLSEVGQMVPITVRRNSAATGYVLVAGRHRLEAARALGWTHIDCSLMEGNESDARLREIAENLHRSELSVLERANHVDAWLKLTEHEGPISGLDVQKSRGPGRPEGGVALAARRLPIPGDTAEARRKSIERLLRIAGISPDAKNAAKEAGLSDNLSALLKIARAETPDAQVAKVDELSNRKTRPRMRRAAEKAAAHAEATDANFRSGGCVTPLQPHGDRPWTPGAPSEPITIDSLRSAWAQGALNRDDWDAALPDVRTTFVIEVLGFNDARASPEMGIGIT
jgi:ParB/RepB/Spo0J family partition protein